jgi:uncharacterized damage-inducible protein DinB
MKTPVTAFKGFLLPLVILLFNPGYSGAQGNHLKAGPVKGYSRTFREGAGDASMEATVARQLNYFEEHILSLAEAMPEEKYYFTPESLGIKGSEFKGVRTFAGQIKHLATDNFDIWRSLTGDPLPEGIRDVNGPENIKTKGEILKFLKESFAMGHRAIATLTEKNATGMLVFRGNSLPRMDLAFYALTHAAEHYGQMVVYLRMCGIVPLANLHAK